ncbi:hypothetical protein M117_0467 [Bacteroides fragilis str. 3774 T13]|nr:hypothetical protein M117_0467 [Bacteroides fragilis str. 3774 T13]
MFTVLKSFVGGYVRNSILIRYDSIRQLSLIVNSKTRNIEQNVVHLQCLWE